MTSQLKMISICAWCGNGGAVSEEENENEKPWHCDPVAADFAFRALVMLFSCSLHGLVLELNLRVV